MKSSFLFLCAAALLLGGCNQSGPASEQPAATPGSPATEAPAPADSAAAAPAPTTESAAPTAAEAVTLSFRFKPITGAEADPMLPKTQVFLVMKGRETKEIDLGRVTGKPDVVDAAKAKRAGFPGGFVVAFRSYEPNSGSGDDLAVMQAEGGRLRVLQRRVDETADQPGTFQTSREIPLPAGTRLQAGK
ncbi:hypothetical protein [Hymenobacter sp. B81]|uniref:hypothetical protein n=1 Tax=Hymenobacter sp. B81 TaxID=3344878 RepID=UPI0037DCD626